MTKYTIKPLYQTNSSEKDISFNSLEKLDIFTMKYENEKEFVLNLIEQKLISSKTDNIQCLKNDVYPIEIIYSDFLKIFNLTKENFISLFINKNGLDEEYIISILKNISTKRYEKSYQILNAIEDLREFFVLYNDSNRNLNIPLEFKLSSAIYELEKAINNSYQFKRDMIILKSKTNQGKKLLELAKTIKQNDDNDYYKNNSPLIIHGYENDEFITDEEIYKDYIIEEETKKIFSINKKK